MKFHALALCVAGSLAASGAAQAGHTEQHRRATEQAGMSRSRDVFMFAGERLYHRIDLYPDLPSVAEVAGKVREIVNSQRQEAATLAAVAGRARPAGFENVASVYEHMVGDHNRVADFGSRWLTERGFSAPPAPAAVAAADMTPQQSVDQQLQHHVETFNRMLADRQNERSSTVRGMQLWSAAGALRHASLLRTLDRDLDFDRKALSARLRAQMDPAYMADRQNELVGMIVREEWGLLQLQIHPPGGPGAQPGQPPAVGGQQ